MPMSEKSNSSFLICGAVAALAGAAGVAIGYQLRKSLKVKASDVKGNDPGMLSSRGTRATIPAISYLPSFMECLHNLYDAKQAKDGYICLAVAENKLGSSRLLVKKWQEVVSTFTEDELAGFQCYADFSGSPQFKSALIQAMNRGPYEYEMDPKYMSVAAGCGAILESLAFALCEEGDAILVPAPLYAAFFNDLDVRAKVKCVAVATEHPEYKITAAALDKAKRDCEAQGLTVRALLLTNPGNPLGSILTADEMHDLFWWSVNNSGVHLISDEIYALGEFTDTSLSPRKFKSMLDFADKQRKGGNQQGIVAENFFKTRLHIVYGLSKDWCSSGSRVGVLYSENESLHGAMGNYCYFCGVPNVEQAAWAKILSDNIFTSTFLADNRQRLSGVVKHARETLQRELGVQSYEPNSGLFIWCDFRKFLSTKTFKAEKELHTRIFKEAKVLLTPGEDCRSSKPGFFRLCIAWIDTETFDVAMRRMKKILC